MVMVQGSLLELDAELAAASGGERTDLGRGAWIELRRSWAPAQSELFERLYSVVGWREEQRPMYDRVVEVPRLVCHYGEDDPLPDARLVEMRSSLNDLYAGELGEPLCTVGMCCYRDNRDSVAWHGDRVGRGATTDTVVAIVSLGASRRLLLRPRGGGQSRAYELGSGDLFVMGGSCQRTFEHSVPKTARRVGTRISLQFRASGVR